MQRTQTGSLYRARSAGSRHPAGSTTARHWCVLTVACSASAAPPLQQLMISSRTNDMTSITTAMRSCTGIVVLLELGNDQQRRDLGHHRHVAGDENHRSVFADRARKRQREAGQQRRQNGGQDHARESLQPRGPKLAAASSSSDPGPPAQAAPCAPRTAGR